MECAYILLFGFYDFIKSSDLMQIDEDVPLDLSMKRQNKIDKKRCAQVYHPYNDASRGYNTLSTNEHQKNTDLTQICEVYEGNRLHNAVTSPVDFIDNTKSNNKSNSLNFFLNHRNEPFTRIDESNSSWKKNIHLLTFEKHQTLLNADSFVSTILNNIISIYDINENLKMETGKFISLNRFNYSYSCEFYDRFNSIDFHLRTNERNDFVEDFEKIENIFCDEKHIFKIFITIVSTELQDLGNQLINFSGFSKKLENFDKKTKIKFLLYKIRT